MLVCCVSKHLSECHVQPILAPHQHHAIHSTPHAPLQNDYEALMRSCLVLVDVDIPLVALADGVHSRSFSGNGLIVYHGQVGGQLAPGGAAVPGWHITWL